MVTIANPIRCSPSREPARHFRLDERRKDKAAKVAAARDPWVPAINNDGRFGRWAFVEITDPWDATNMIRAAPASSWARAHVTGHGGKAAARRERRTGYIVAEASK